MSQEAPAAANGPALGSAALRRRVHVRMTSEQLEELTAAARANGMSRGALVRHLVELGRQVMTRQAPRDLELLALAALLASEQGLELLQQIVPEGRHRALLAREVAVTTAEARLEELRTQLARESSDA